MVGLNGYGIRLLSIIYTDIVKFYKQNIHYENIYLDIFKSKIFTNIFKYISMFLFNYSIEIEFIPMSAHTPADVHTDWDVRHDS